MVREPSEWVAIAEQFAALMALGGKHVAILCPKIANPFSTTMKIITPITNSSGLSSIHNVAV